ncbi:MAG: STAS/SEC14 domain-containing protein [Phycisphaerae bacterium]|nr:STAS/SEC14 domain-containing protein [Phycisphaerae bacterium]MDD5380144.1 STAS/SEC14 domain-containing protein [Phycisphaerae bacterium]
MDWTIDYLEKDRIVSVKASGVMDWDEHKRFAEELYPFAKEHGSHKILIDFRQMQPKFTISQIDDLPDMLMKIGVGPEFKIAAVSDPASPHGHEFKFFNNVATILGIRVKQFADPDEALTWLKSG